MDLRRAAARCLVLGFEGKTLPGEARALLEEGAGGVILFRRNVGTLEQVLALTEEIRAAARAPVLLSVDQEGGRVARLKGLATDLPPMRAIHHVKDAETVGRVLGAELSALGFDIDWAPCMDVDTNPANPVIGDRSFSRDPYEVAQLGSALIRTMQAAGLAACAKHFPGHGDTEVDSHQGLPRLFHDRARLDQVEFLPFEAAIAANVASVMTAHVVLEAVDPDAPATMSVKVVDLLRRNLGYDGLVVTDDLEMAAVADHHDLGDAAVAAISAGVDQVLVCHRADRQRMVLEALVRAAEDGTLSEPRLADAVYHVDQVVKRFNPWRKRPTLNTVRSEGNLRLAMQLGGGKAQADPTGDR